MEEKDTRVSRDAPAGSRRREFLKGAGKLTGSAAVLSMSGLAAACGSDDSGSSTAMTSGGRASIRGATISFWTMPNLVAPQAWADFRKELISDFKARTGVTVEWTSLVMQSFFQKWNLAMANGSPPDVGDMFFLQSRVVMGKGKWGPLDITDRMKAGEFGSLDGISPAALTEAQWEGKYYGVPWRIATWPMVCNSDLVPEPPKTIEELEQMGMQLVASKGLKGAGMTWGGVPGFMLLTVGNIFGALMLSADLKSSNFDDPRWVDALTWLQKMINEKVLLRDVGLDNATGASFDNLLRGQIGLILDCDSSILQVARSTAPQMVRKLKSAPLPIGPTGRSSALAGSAQFSVFENSKNVEAGIEWIKYLVSPEVNKRMCAITGQGPASYAVQDELATPFTRPFYEATKTAIPAPPTPAAAELNADPGGPVSILVRAVFSGQDVRAALATAHASTNKILAKYP